MFAGGSRRMGPCGCRTEFVPVRQRGGRGAGFCAICRDSSPDQLIPTTQLASETLGRTHRAQPIADSVPTTPSRYLPFRVVASIEVVCDALDVQQMAVGHVLGRRVAAERSTSQRH